MLFFKKGEKIHVADTFSRVSLPDTRKELSEEIYQTGSIYNKEILNFLDAVYENVKVETIKDPLVIEFKRIVLNG